LPTLRLDHLVNTVYSVTIGLVVGLYFLGAVALLTRGFAWLKWLSPFQYVDAPASLSASPSA